MSQEAPVDDASAVGETADQEPRRRGPWPALRGGLARYLRFWGRHRFFGCLGLLFALLGLCTIVTAVTARLPIGDRSLAPVEQIEVNQIETVLNDPQEPIDDYIAGMIAFDAQRMWSAYSDSARAEITARGRSAEALQRGLDQAKAAGARVNGVEQIGDYPLRDGRRYLFYIVSRSGFPPSGGDEELYFIFTVDPTGHILNVT